VTIASTTRAFARFVDLPDVPLRVLPEIQFRETDNMRWLRSRSSAWAEIAKISAAEVANPEFDA